MLTKAYAIAHKDEIIADMKAGKLFIYPTDTIYGIGCNASNGEAVDKIRTLKKRDTNPFSVIAPSQKWIESTCIIPPMAKEWMKKLPGPYTLILPLKDASAISPKVVEGSVNLGIRVPNNWFMEFVQEANIAFVTTSANISGRATMTDFYSLDPFIKEGVDYVIYEGALNKKASTIVNLTKDKPEIITR